MPSQFAAFVPSGTVLASQAVPPDDYPFFGKLLPMIVFSNPATVTAGMHIALVFRGMSPPVCDIFFYDGNPYPDGESLTLQTMFSPDWSATGGVGVQQDLAFETIIAP
jgi:hypothetical protein